MKKLSVYMTRTEKILGWIYLFVQLLVLPEILVLGNLLLGSPLSDAELNFVFFCLNFICVTVIFHRFLAASAKVSFSAPWRCLRSAFLGFVLYWLLNFAVSILIAVVYPDFSNVNDASISTLVQENSQLMTFGTVLLVPLVEEVLYRGLIFRGLYERNRAVAYIVSTAAFGALHVVSYIGLYEPLHLIMCFIQYIPAGLCLAWAYVRADSVWAPVLIHITINQIGILSMR